MERSMTRQGEGGCKKRVYEDNKMKQTVVWKLRWAVWMDRWRKKQIEWVRWEYNYKAWWKKRDYFSPSTKRKQKGWPKLEIYGSQQRRKCGLWAPIGMMKCLSDLTSVKTRKNGVCLKEADGGFSVSVTEGTGRWRS